MCRLSTEEFSHYAALTHCVGRGASCSFGEDDHCCRGDGDGDGDEDEVGDGDHGDVTLPGISLPLTIPGPPVERKKK